MAISLEHNSAVDRAFIKVKSGSKLHVDELDGPKLDNEQFDLATLSVDSILLAINVLPSIPCDSIIPLRMKDMAHGEYRLKVTANGEFEKFDVSIEDAFLKKLIPLPDSGYTFYVDENNLSFAEQRFAIVLKPKEILVDISLHPSRTLLCKNDSLEIVLDNAQSHVRYELWESERLVSATCTLYANEITEGYHEFRVKANALCSSSFLDETIKITKQSPSIVRIQHGKICQQGVATLEAEASGSTDRLHWFRDESLLFFVAYGSTFQTDLLQKTQHYFVAAQSDQGCLSEPQRVIAEVISFDSIRISQHGNILQSSYPENNQWYYNNVKIPEAIQAFLEVEVPGHYTVVNQFDGCSTSDDFDFIVLGIDHEEDITIYPNPVQDKLLISGLDDRVREIQLLDGKGIVIESLHFNEGKSQKTGIFELNAVASGIYFLKLVRHDRSTRIFRLLKL
ncbi:MAG: T9SS type A sorting domain-containing protein [Cyclobacteriaceae bacterium]|nr:T9SS type A sorting domain-containing protein [Cyclobacteriaceae bacterium]